jgi:hypothetical protein
MGGESIRVALIVLGDYLVELLEKHTLIVVCLVVHVQRVEHFKNFLVVDIVTCQARQLLELIVIDEIVLVFIDQFEDSFKSFFGLDITYLGSHEFHKLFEVDRLVLDSESIDDVVDKATFSSLSQLFHDLADFLGVNGAGMVDVE